MESADAAKAAKLLLKAVRSLPEDEQALALGPLVERGISPPAAAAPSETGRLPASVQIGHMLLAGHSVEDAARLEGVPEDVIRATLGYVGSRPGTDPALTALLELVAQGRSPGQAMKKLDLPKAEFTRLLSHLLGPGPPLPAQFFPAATPGGPQRMVPVRFPEPQYDRLKDWCATHGFPMAAVVRGLVERFLDEQERRAA